MKPRGRKTLSDEAIEKIVILVWYFERGYWESLTNVIAAENLTLRETNLNDTAKRVTALAVKMGHMRELVPPEAY